MPQKVEIGNLPVGGTWGVAEFLLNGRLCSVFYQNILPLIYTTCLWDGVVQPKKNNLGFVQFLAQSYNSPGAPFSYEFMNDLGRVTRNIK